MRKVASTPSLPGNEGKEDETMKTPKISSSLERLTQVGFDRCLCNWFDCVEQVYLDVTRFLGDGRSKQEKLESLLSIPDRLSEEGKSEGLMCLSLSFS